MSCIKYLPRVRINNGNDACSPYELAKGFIRPIVTGTLRRLVPKDIVTARETLIAKSKLNLILKSKLTSVSPIRVGDLVQVVIKLQNEKREKVSDLRPVLPYDKKSDAITVQGQNGRKIIAAAEDVRLAITDNELALKYQAANDVMGIALNESIDSLNEKDVKKQCTTTRNPKNLVLHENSKLSIRSKSNGH